MKRQYELRYVRINNNLYEQISLLFPTKTLANKVFDLTLNDPYARYIQLTDVDDQRKHGGTFTTYRTARPWLRGERNADESDN